MAEKELNNGTETQETKEKVSLKDKMKNAVEKERIITWSWGKVIRTVALVAAIPVAFVAGKSMQKAKDDELMDLALGDNTPEPLALPQVEQEYVEVPAEEVAEPEYVEEYVEE